MRLPRWTWVLFVGLAISALGVLFGAMGIARIVVVLGFVYITARRLSADRALTRGPWRFAIIGGTLALLHALARSVHGAIVDEVYPFPSPVEPLAYLAYFFMIGGGLRMVRARTTERRRDDTTDAAILAVSIGMVLVNLLFTTYLRDPTVPVLDRTLVVAYLGCVMIHSGVVARIAFGPGERNASYYLLAVGTLAIVVNDVLLRGFITGWAWGLDAAYVIAPIAFVFTAAAVSHPAVVHLTERPRYEYRRVRGRRLGMLAGALLLGPTMLVLDNLGTIRIDRIGTICGSAVLGMLVLLRMTDLVRSKESAADRERSLRTVATTLATVSDRAGVLRAAVTGSLEITRAAARARVSLYRADASGDLVLLESAGSQNPTALRRIPARALVELGLSVDLDEIRSLENVRPLDVPDTGPAFVTLVPLGAASGERMMVVATQESVFTQEQVAAYESFSAQVSLALESVQLREEMHQRRSNRRFRALVENSSDVVLVVDRDETVGFASPTVRRLLGREEGAVLGRRLTELVHRPDQVHLRRLLAAPANLSGNGFSVEVRLLHGSGELRWFEVEARDLTDEDEVKGLVVTARDISDRKRAEAQLLRSEARFRLMVQNSSDVVAIVDDNSLITYVSPSIERMLGYTAPELLGRNVFEFLSITEAERLRAIEVLELSGTRVEVRVQGLDGRVHALEVGVTDMREQPEVDGIVLNIRDVTERKTLEDDLRHQALHDDLTGLANRALFADRVRAAVTSTSRSGELVAVLFVDLDDFKLINDSLGHVVGDQVLVAVADRIQQCLSLSDLAARLGGDEFAVLLTGVQAEDDIIDVADRIREAIGRPLKLANHEFRLTASLGIAIDQDASRSGEDLLRSADLAMYQAKQDGKDRHEIFEDQMEVSAHAELELKNALLRAIENNEFVLHYQPIVDMATSQIEGVEALIRWEDPNRGMVSPASFIPVAEETGLICPIGMWVAAQAAHDLARWRAMGFDIYCSINVSGRQLSEEGFADRFSAKIAASGVDPRSIVIELTESVLASEGASEMFERFHRDGLRLALDDFGTGYSAFQYLQTFHIDIIKIDRSFVQAMNTDADAGVVEAVLDVARRIGAQTVAEGIEDAAEHHNLKQLGVELGQGYYFSRPVPADRMEALLRDERDADLPAIVN